MNMNKRIILWGIFMLFIGILDSVASSPTSQVKSFIAQVPDTVTQGEPFIVSYKLTASSWKAGSRPISDKGFFLKSVSYSHKKGMPYSELTANAIYVTSLCGDLELPEMTVTIGNQVVKSTKKTIFIQQNKVYGEEMTYAHHFLLKQGKDSDSLCLTITERNKHFWVFENLYNKGFCLVAKKDVWPVVGLPVLAYSTESIMGLNYEKSKNYAYIREPYNKQIEALLKTKGVNAIETKKPYQPQHTAIAPLLGQQMWGQNEPYNRFSPTLDGKKTVTGCVPLATAMAASYHKWPNKGQSHTYYQVSNKEIYKLDFSSSEILWDSFQKEYNRNDSTPGMVNLAKFITFLGLAIDAEFKNEATSAYLRNIKPVLCNNLKYSGKLSYYYESLLNEENIESLLYYEIDNNRPCIVSCNGHAFICDGYKDGFFHYNLGWRGSYNGFYRLKLGNYQLPEGVNNLLLIKEIVCGIEPQKEMLEKEVTLTKDCRLDQVLSIEEKENLTSLIINGPLYSSDIILLRKMAGALDAPSFSGWNGGSLRKLNLANAYITSDKTTYLTEKATGGWTHWEQDGNYRRTVEYKFETMTEKEWKHFKSDIGSKQDGLFYTRKDDNTYWVNYTCQKNVIGKHMFADCSSLCAIILPNDTKKIDDYAFLRCISLQGIRLPEKVEEVGKTPFHTCTVLEKVLAPKKMSSSWTICEKCSPVLRKVERY